MTETPNANQGTEPAAPGAPLIGTPAIPQIGDPTLPNPR
ncbi:hypothetical protein FRUB_08966 [Fimbriiglobus ruber]|uniref:Uncharacterized protein n=1 Tax=Fimbriiglobus ruber TaxID=1908690 RepID=A0A225D5Z7_9BACT|nr:hypothetical protein FRUB_08966 [Fimbriiglobus ruber]